MSKQTKTLRERTFERLRKSIAGEKSDAHAAFNLYTYPFFHNVTKVPVTEYLHNPRIMFETQLEVIERLEKCANFAPDAGPVAECSGLGAEICTDKYGFLSVKAAPINDLDDALKLKPGDPYGDNYMRICLEAYEYMLNHAPADLEVNLPSVQGPFTIAAQLRGISQFCGDIIEDPDLANALIDISCETLIGYLKAYEKILGKSLHHILIGDDLSAFLSPSKYEEWVLPTYRKIFQEFPGTQYWLHNDANTQHLFTQIRDSGFQAWQYAPSLKPEEVLEGTDSKISIIGGLNPVEMQRYSPQETYEKCIHLLESFQGNNKYVLGAGGTINQVPLKCVMAMIHAADDYKIIE